MPWNGNNASTKNGRAAPKNRVSLMLRVEALEKCSPENASSWDAWISPRDRAFAGVVERDGRAYIYARTYPNHLVNVKIHGSVPPGSIWLGEIQRKNFEVCTESSVLFSIHEAIEPDLFQIILDVRYVQFSFLSSPLSTLTTNRY